MKQETHIENIRALHSALVTKRATLDQLIWQANRAGISDDNRFRLLPLFEWLTMFDK